MNFKFKLIIYSIIFIATVIWIFFGLEKNITKIYFKTYYNFQFIISNDIKNNFNVEFKILDKVAKDYDIINIKNINALNNKLKFYYDFFPIKISSLTRIDENGTFITAYPRYKQLEGVSLRGQKHIEEVLKYREKTIGPIFKTVQGYLAFTLAVPIFYNNKFVGILSTPIGIDHLPDFFVKGFEKVKKFDYIMFDDEGFIYINTKRNVYKKNKIKNTLNYFKINKENILELDNDIFILKPHVININGKKYNVCLILDKSEYENIHYNIYKWLFLFGVFFVIFFGLIGFSWWKSYGATIKFEKEREYREYLERMSDALKRANRLLMEEDKNKNNILSNLSHELRTPLVPIKGYIDLLISDRLGRVSDEHKEIFNIIEKSMNRLSNTIDQLIEASKTVLSNEKDELFIEKYDLISQLKGIIKIEEILAKKKNIKISLKGKDYLEVKWDINKMETVFLNLIDNAIKFNREGGKVEIKIDERKEIVEIYVKDTGVGIEDSKIDRIFEKFYQVDSSSTRAYGGLGMGLYLVKSIVDLHDGTIQVVSTSEEGTVFKLEIPKNLA